MATVISARLSARYEGRIEAALSVGDVVMIIRDYKSGGDGSVVLLSAASGVLPRNWMPAGSTHEKVLGGYRFVHEKKQEILEVYIDKIYFELHAPGDIDTHLEKIGAEKEFADLLAADLDLIEPGLELIGREVPTLVGPIDILAWDSFKRPVIIEVKRRKANGGADLYQWKRYWDAIHSDPAWGRKKPRGFIVAPSATRSLTAAHQDRTPA